MKKMTRNIKYVMLAAVLAVCSCGNDEFAKPDYYDVAAETKIGKAIVEGAADYIGHIKNEELIGLGEGASLLDFGYLNKNGYAMQMYLYDVVLGTSQIRVLLPDDIDTIGEPETLADQAASMENNARYMVYGAISGGAFDGKGQPAGILYRDGNALSSSMGAAPAFFATLKDGSAVCLEAESFPEVRKNIDQGVSGGVMLVKDGYVLSQADVSAEARSAIGVSEDGTEVFMMVVDGGDFYYSNGITCGDLATLMKACGAYAAMTLDKGANVSAVWRNERSESIFELLNKPSNKGLEPAVANGLAVVVK